MGRVIYSQYIQPYRAEIDGAYKKNVANLINNLSLDGMQIKDGYCLVTEPLEFNSNPFRQYDRPHYKRKERDEVLLKQDSIKFNKITDLYARGILK